LGSRFIYIKHKIQALQVEIFITLNKDGLTLAF